MPLHDVWRLELPGGGEHTIDDVRALLAFDGLARVNPVVRFLFALRGALGRLFGWDRERPAARSDDGFAARLSEADRAASRVAPGTPDGPFRVLYVFADEAASEIRNATVHACSVLALSRSEAGHTLWWAIYVRPVGGITRFYMALIDPFRRLLVYPAVLRHVERAWRARQAS